MRVLRVLAHSPEGEGEEIGTVETLIEAKRMAGSTGWYRVYGSLRMFECLWVQLNYTWERERDLWNSDHAGAFGEPPTIPAGDDADDRTDDGFWISPSDPLFNADFSVHEIVSLADSPMWCARCERMLEPGTDAARALDSTGERGIVCRDCGGQRPSGRHPVLSE